MKTAAAIAFAIMCLAAAAQSAEPTAYFETVAEAPDSVAFNRCIEWGGRAVCSI